MPPDGTATDRPGGGGDAATPSDRSAPGSPSSLGLGVALALGLFAALVLAGVAGATVPAGQFDQSNDTEGPTVGNLAKVDDTTVELRIEDDVDVDEGTVDSGDFLLDSGRIANVTAEESGTDAAVRIELGAPLNTDELTVTVPADATIADAAGNGLQGYEDDRRTVDDMDGVAPLVLGYRVRRVGNDTVSVRVRTDDPVASLDVELDGPSPTRLGADDFSRSGDGSTYDARVRPGADGEYAVTLVDLTDPNGNRNYLDVTKRVTLDSTPPDAVAFVDVSASQDGNYTFDATRTTDLSPLRNLTWDMGDGTTRRGERVSHRFAPGNYTVTLRAVDAFGHVGTARVFVRAGERVGNDSAATDSATVRVTGAREADSAIVHVADAVAGRPVWIPAGGGGPVAETGPVALDRVTVTTATNASYRLGVRADGPETLGEFESRVGGTGLGGLTVVHDVPDADLEAVAFRIAVDRSAIAAAEGDPADLALYRRHDGDWTALETTIVDRSAGTVRYRATAPGFSRFAVAVGGEGGSVSVGEANESGDRTVATAASPTATPGTTAAGGESGGGLGAALAALPLGLFEALVRYVGSLLVAGFLLLKALALVMGY